jgi:outer membrane protein assembly factor BamB
MRGREQASKIELIMNTTASLVRRVCLGFVPLALGTIPLCASAANWPQWRGPEGIGATQEKNLPLHWDTNTNVRWRAPLPDRGNSTPIVWGQQVFVTQATAKDNRRALLCFDRTNGRLLWDRGVTPDDKELTHATNPQCSGSPTTDGERVVAWFGSAGLYCWDLNGKELWHRELGKQRHIWGNGSSPVIHGGLVYLNFGPGEPSFLLAVDKITGKDAWRVNEPNADSGEKKPGEEKPRWTGSWSTPVFISVEGRAQLLMSWPQRLIAFEPETGREAWSCAGLNDLVYTSPLHDQGVVVAMGGYGGKSLAVRAGGRGEVTASRRLWHHPKTKQRIGSGVLHDGHLYILNEDGLAHCNELETGKLVWDQRLTGTGKDNTSWSSMIRAGDRLYAVNHSGDTFVLRASPRFELLATNSIGEHTESSLAASDDELFLRTHRALWCLGATQ